MMIIYLLVTLLPIIISASNYLLVCFVEFQDVVELLNEIFPHILDATTQSQLAITSDIMTRQPSVPFRCSQTCSVQDIWRGWSLTQARTRLPLLKFAMVRVATRGLAGMLVCLTTWKLLQVNW